MLDALAITEEEAQGLSELAALDLAMAKDFAARVQAEADPAVKNDLARSYQRVARSYRQTLALKMRLAREVASHAREVGAGAGRGGADAALAGVAPLGPPALRRADEVRDAVARIVWSEHE